MHNNFLQKKHRSIFKLRRYKIKAIALLFIFISICTVLYILITIINGKNLSSNISAKTEFSKNAFLKFFYKTKDISGKEVAIFAEKVTEETKDNFIFEQVTSNFMLSNEENGTITSNKGKIQQGTKTICQFIDNVVMTTNSGLILRTNNAVFDSEKKIISGNSRVNIKRNETILSAESYTFDADKNILTLKKNAKAHNPIQNISANEISIAFNSNYTDSIQNLTANGNASLISTDYDLSGESLKYEPNKITAMENIDLIYKKYGKNLTVKSDEMTAYLNNKSDITEIIANGNVYIKTKDSIVKGNNGVYKDNKVVISGNVIISKKQGNIFGEIAELDLITEKVSVKKSSGILINKKGKK
ncbi:MAG: LPS export ABC transporter periplasmic protein LptC [Alphaproteobacteria bacterium]|nr:LPS export ABC transporter periplasmic protein LptC [Alphaproteobacteria bacterium]